MAAAWLRASSSGPALLAAYAAGFGAGFGAGYHAHASYIEGCTGLPVSRAQAVRRVATMHRGWVVSCRRCAAWHVLVDEDRQRDLIRERYRRERAVPVTYEG